MIWHVEMEWPYLFFIVNVNIITYLCYSTPGPNLQTYVLPGNSCRKHSSLSVNSFVCVKV